MQPVVKKWHEIFQPITCSTWVQVQAVNTVLTLLPRNYFVLLGQKVTQRHRNRYSFLAAKISLFMYISLLQLLSLRFVVCLPFPFPFLLPPFLICHLLFLLLRDLCHSLGVVRSQLIMMMHLVSHCLPGRVHLLQIVSFYQHA